MTVPTFTKTGSKSSTSTTLDKSIFNIKVENHDVIKQAYVAYLANGRINLATTKKRGEVRGGGRKPWRQKGTGRARFGSIRNPIWRGGGVVFGPSGNENYSHKLSLKTKRLAIKQALSIKSEANAITIVEDFNVNSGKTKDAITFLNKINAHGTTLVVVDSKNQHLKQALSNIANVKLTTDLYINVFDIINADSIVIVKKSLENISNWLGSEK